MGRIVVGWIAVLVALVALILHMMPGAISLLGLFISLAALILSMGSVRGQSMAYVQATLILVVVGIWGLNIELRLVASLDDMPLQFRWALYGLAGLVIAGCWYAAKAIDASSRLD